MTANHRLMAAALAAPALALALGACSIDIDFGEPETRTYQVESFDKVDIGNAFDAEIVVGPETMVEIETGENVHERLKVEVDDGTLEIKVHNRISFNNGGPMKVVIHTPSLVGLEASGATDVTIDGIDAYDFDMDISGASSVDATGSIAELKLDASGASDVDLSEVEIGQADIDLSGASSTRLDQASNVTGEASGASSIDVADDAIVSVSTSGASSIS